MEFILTFKVTKHVQIKVTERNAKEVKPMLIHLTNAYLHQQKRTLHVQIRVTKRNAEKVKPMLIHLTNAYLHQQKRTSHVQTQTYTSRLYIL